MRRLADLVRQLAYRLRGARNDAEVDEEMRLHLELRAEQARAQGLDPATARRRFGNPTLLREQGQDAWGWTYFDGWLRDIREAWRTLLASPGFTATAVVSLALGIGANTAIFSLVNALLLRTLPVEDPRELVQLAAEGGARPTFTNPLWEEIRDRQDVFAGMLAYSTVTFDLASSGETDPVEGLWVSGSFFRMLGVSAMRGRVLAAEDDRRGGGPDGPVAVISYRFWETRYAKDENVVGKTISLNREPFRIVGVTPPWFTGLDTDRSFGVAIPISCDPLLLKDGSRLDDRSTWWLSVLGRLRANAPIEAAAGRMKVLSPAILRATVPADYDGQRRQTYLDRELTALPAATGFSGTGRRYETALYSLMAIAALVLLIACANIANLLLARSAQRERDLSMRVALGAGRGRLVRRLLCESFLVAIVGAGAGLGLALIGSRFLVRLMRTQGGSLVVDLTPDMRVLAFTASVATLTAIIFGLTPALRATRIRLNDVLKEGARSASPSGRRLWLGKAIVTGQVALSLVLLAGAALFAGTMRNLMAEDLGFDPDNVLAVRVEVESAGVPKDRRVEMFIRMLERLRAIPGVESAAQSRRLPMSSFGWDGDVEPEGFTPQSRLDAFMTFNRVSPGYFETIRTPLLSGRDFTPSDVVGSPQVMVIDEHSARRFWPGESPIGKRIEWGRRGTFEVVGVVEPSKYYSVTDRPMILGYVPSGQDEDPDGRVFFFLRSREAANLAPAVRDAIGEVSPMASLSFVELEVQVDESTTQQQIVAMLSAVFAGLALLLCVVGLYGVTSYTAARRRGEIGIRIALGAPPGSVVWLMVRDLTLVLGIGLALGWAGSVGLSGAVESLLFGVEPGDPRLLGLAALILAGVSALAAYVPARRASKLQPIAVLREE
jgi:predicted permease